MLSASRPASVKAGATDLRTPRPLQASAPRGSGPSPQRAETGGRARRAGWGVSRGCYLLPMDAQPPTLEEIRAARARIAPYVVETPVWRWRGDEVERACGTQPILKLELFQHAGS